MTQDQEGREHQQMKEVWSLWQMLLKIVMQHVKNFLEPRDFHKRQYSVFWLIKKRKISARLVPHCWTETGTPGHCYLAERKIRGWSSSILGSNCRYWWIRDFEPEFNLESKEWRVTGFPRLKKFRWVQWKVKQMIFGDRGGLKLPNICLAGEEKPHPGNLSQPRIEPGPTAWQACILSWRMSGPATSNWGQFLCIFLHESTVIHSSDISFTWDCICHDDSFVIISKDHHLLDL